MDQDDLEKKAAQAHDIWAHWMKYFLNRFAQPDGSRCAVFIVPTPDYTRWLSQMKTKYEDLTEEEKDSDREIAKRYLMEK